MLQLWEAGAGLGLIPLRMLSGPRRFVQEFEISGAALTFPELFIGPGG